MPISVTYGYTSVHGGLNTTNKDYTIDTATSLNNLITAVRVKDIVLDSEHPQFKTVGEWNGLGTIFFDVVKDANSSNKNTWATARPISPNIKNYPLINEIVYLISFPDTGIGTNPTSGQLYYINTVGIWNTPHQNGYPIISSIPPPSQQKTYNQTELGSSKTVTNQYTEINLGKTFKEKGNIHPLLPFEGDIIYEGRWGNSIRFGSTVKNTPNNWSSIGNNGDPIIIIRNGQSVKADNKGWIPITENINDDLSSIYLTSTQTIPLNPASQNYLSYKDNAPQNISKYSGQQLIFNSGRIVLNSSKDHLLLTSNKSINLNSINSVNIDSPLFIVQANEVYLGSKSATEPVLLGDSTVKLLKQLTTNLKAFMTTCKNLMAPSGGGPIIPLQQAASQLETTLEQINLNLDNVKSKSVKTV